MEWTYSNRPFVGHNTYDKKIRRNIPVPTTTTTKPTISPAVAVKHGRQLEGKQWTLPLITTSTPFPLQQDEFLQYLGDKPGICPQEEYYMDIFLVRGVADIHIYKLNESHEEVQTDSSLWRVTKANEQNDSISQRATNVNSLVKRLQQVLGKMDKPENEWSRVFEELYSGLHVTFEGSQDNTSPNTVWKKTADSSTTKVYYSTLDDTNYVRLPINYGFRIIPRTRELVTFFAETFSEQSLRKRYAIKVISGQKLLEQPSPSVVAGQNQETTNVLEELDKETRRSIALGPQKMTQGFMKRDRTCQGEKRDKTKKGKKQARCATPTSVVPPPFPQTMCLAATTEQASTLGSISIMTCTLPPSTMKRRSSVSQTTTKTTSLPSETTGQASFHQAFVTPQEKDVAQTLVQMSGSRT
jgi:hypothetical protein